MSELKWYRLKALVTKDLTEFKKSKYVLSAMIGMPIIFAILSPVATILPITKAPREEFGDEAHYSEFFLRAFTRIVPNWNSLDPKSQTLIIMAYSMFVMVLFLPAILPAVTASEAIVGEKERKTMEALLVSPLKKEELVLGKIISSLIPSFIVTVLTSIVYFVYVDISLYPYINYILFPDWFSMLLVFVFAPLISILSVQLMLLVSTKVKSTRDAYQFGSLIILPVLALIISQMASMFFFSNVTLVIGTVLMLVLIYVLYRIALKIFDREQAIAKLV